VYHLFDMMVMMFSQKHWTRYLQC